MSEVTPYKYGIPWHDFSLFNGCFGNSQVMPTDVDGIVERRGNFLFIEFKTDGKSVSTGQLITLKKLGRLKMFVVVVIWHEPCKIHDPKIPTAMQILPSGKKTSADTASVRDFVKKWWSKADKAKR